MDSIGNSKLYRHELIQARLRIFSIFVVLVVIYYISNFLENKMFDYMHCALLCAFIFLFIAIVFFAFLKTFPRKYVSSRKYIILFIDILSITLGVFIFNDKGIIFNPLYIWIIVGYTIRYGKRFFLASIVGIYVAIGVLASYHTFWIENTQLTIAVLFAVTIIPIYVLTLYEDIQKKNTELEMLLKKTKHIANHDVLTNLPNRHFFYSELNATIEKNEPFYLLFFDLDGFKDVNDKYGHEAGDNVLIDVANRLKKDFGDDNFVARLGGDEFVSIYKKHDYKEFISNVEKSLQDIIKPYGVNEDIDGISVSIGISQYPYDSEESFKLKNFADKAMYQAKKDGKNRMVFYSDMKS